MNAMLPEGIMKTRIFAAAAFLVLLTGNTLGATYSVELTGVDTNPGTAQAPLRTVQKAINLAVAGDTVLVGNGFFDESVKSLNAGNPGQPIVLDGQGKASLRRVTLNKNYITVKGFTIHGEANAGSSAIYIDFNANFALITNNIIDTQQKLGVNGLVMVTDTFDPLKTNAPRHCLIISNSIGNILGCTAAIVAGRFNEFKLNTVTNIYTSDFLRLFGHTNLVQNNRFLNNIMREGIGNHPDFIQTFGENKQSSLGHIINANVVSNVIGGQLCQTTMVNSYTNNQHGGWVFQNNVFSDIHLQASIGIPNIKWLHNNFIRCNQVGGSHALALGNSDGRSLAEGAVILNNVFLDCGKVGQDNQGWYARAVTNIVANHNFVAKGSFLPVREENPPSAFRWFEPNGINGGNPSLVESDFRILPGSSLVGKGAPGTGVTADFYGRERPANSPTIGAFEPEVGLSAAPRPPVALRVIP